MTSRKRKVDEEEDLFVQVEELSSKCGRTDIDQNRLLIEERTFRFTKSERNNPANQAKERKHVKEMITTFSPNSIVGFADGSCPTQHSTTASGVVLCIPTSTPQPDRCVVLSNMSSADIRIASESKTLHNTGYIESYGTNHYRGTNQTAELMALWCVFHLLENPKPLVDPSQVKTISILNDNLDAALEQCELSSTSASAMMSTKTDWKDEMKQGEVKLNPKDIVKETTPNKPNQTVYQQVDKKEDKEKKEVVGPIIEGKEEKKQIKETDEDEKKEDINDGKVLSGNLEIFTDSDYALNSVANPRWNGTKNLGIIHSVKAQIARRLDRFPTSYIRFHHVYGHVDVPGNHRVDKLAEIAIRSIPNAVSRSGRSETVEISEQ